MITTVAAPQADVRPRRTGAPNRYASGQRLATAAAATPAPETVRWEIDADRGYSSAFGNRDQYKSIYRQGYEQGYQQGYGRRF